MHLDKKFFIEIMSEVQKAWDYKSSLNDFFHDNGVDGYIFQPDCICPVLKLLGVLFEDKEDWIHCFAFELNFGRSWKPGMTPDRNGKDIPLTNAEELYDLLTCDKGVMAS